MGEDKFKWAHDLVDANHWVLHAETNVAGKVVKFYDPNGYVSELSDDPAIPVSSAVIGLHNGHHFIADDKDAFIPMSEQEVRFFGTMTLALVEATKQFAAFAVINKVPEAIGVRLIASAFEQQCRAFSSSGQFGALKEPAA